MIGAPLAYRAHIDGLRAIAILAVVLGHVGIPGFSGGFVGVDVFFVISGYLIIGQIAEGLHQGTFSFSRFWARRILRIMPPLLAMLVVSLAIAPFILVTPAEYREFGHQVLYSALMVVNFYFLDAQNYFDTDAILKPLLHMWSLAVEEQFYLLAPLALCFGWKLGKSTALFAAIALFALSLLAAVLLTEPSKNVAFYVVLCRAWEFMAGGAILLIQRRLTALSPMVLETVAIFGLLMIAGSVTSLSEASLFPSYVAILPVAGTALVIAAGSAGAAPLTIRLLGSWPFVAVGLVSYGWYLWHWPLLSFIRIRNFGETDLGRDLAAVTIALAAAVASYFLVEKPSRALRHSPLAFAGSRRVVAGGVLCTLFVALGSTLHSARAIAVAEANIPEAMRPEKNTKVMRGDPCWMTDPEVLSPECIAEVLGKRGTVVLIGDSHARMLYPALKRDAERRGLALVSLWRTGCSPFFRERASLIDPKERNCDNYAEVGLRTLQETLPGGPDFAIIGGYWAKLVHGVSFAERQAGAVSHEEPVSPERHDRFVAALSTLLDTVTAMGTKRITLVGPSAEFARLPVECVARAKALGLAVTLCDVPRQEMNDWLEPVAAVLKDALRSRPDVAYIDTEGAFCLDEACAPAVDGKMYFADTHHLSAEGAEHILQNAELLAAGQSEVPGVRHASTP